MNKLKKAIFGLCALSVIFSMTGCSTVSNTKISELFPNQIHAVAHKSLVGVLQQGALLGGQL